MSFSIENEELKANYKMKNNSSHYLYILWGFYTLKYGFEDEIS
jgi:hypothetical protein